MSRAQLCIVYSNIPGDDALISAVANKVFPHDNTVDRLLTSLPSHKNIKAKMYV